MRMRYRCVFSITLLAALMLVLTSNAAAAKVNLRFSMWINSAAEVDGQLALLKEYMAQNPDVSIELYQQGFTGYSTKLLTMAAGGVAPDVMVLSRVDLPNFAETGVVQPIDTWLSKEPTAFKRDIIELVSGTYKQQVYGIPIWGGPTVMEYNADLFDNAGLASPISLAKKNAWTMDTWIEFGRKITRDTDGDGSPNIFMQAKLNTGARDWYIKIRNMGADVLTANGQPYTDATALEKALQTYQDMAWRYHITPTGKETSNWYNGTEATAFTWIADTPNRFKGVKGAFREELATIPTGPNGKYTMVGGCPIVISSQTPHAYEAYKFARWYAMESKHWQLRGIPADWTSMRREYRDYLGTMFSWPDAVSEVMTGQYTMEPGVGIKYTDLNKGWNDTLTKLVNNQMSAHEAALRIIEHTKQVLADAK